jgi:uracil-DNA glycosylase
MNERIGPRPSDLNYPRQSPVPATLARVHHGIVSCQQCPRLRTYCAEVAIVRRASYRDEVYWGRPVPGYGDASARLLVVGLAPAAHGANRTGRVFTGDGVNGSGDFLMRAMHRAGFASQPTSRDVDDGLRLIDAYVAAAVRCAPPLNKPTPGEVDRCLEHLEAEFSALRRVAVVVTLGRIAFDAWRRLMARRQVSLPGGVFAHGHLVRPEVATTAPLVLQSYHPSRQNTHTGRLTDAMLADVFLAAKGLVDARA